MVRQEDKESGSRSQPEGHRTGGTRSKGSVFKERDMLGQWDKVEGKHSQTERHVRTVGHGRREA